MKVSDIGTGSLHLRVPHVGSANADSHWNATNQDVPAYIANRVPVVNNLLAALPRKECLHLLDDLEQVTLPYGEVLYESGEQMKYVYFPNDSVIALLALAGQH